MTHKGIDFENQLSRYLFIFEFKRETLLQVENK